MVNARRGLCRPDQDPSVPRPAADWAVCHVPAGGGVSRDLLWYGVGVTDVFLQAAIEAAKAGRADDDGIPVGSVLVIDNAIVGRGYNRRVQKSSPILHAEIDCLGSAGRLLAAEYRRATLYTTLSPCDMCSGAILLYGVSRVVVGENRTFRGPEDYLRSRGVVLDIANSAECYDLMQEFIARHPEIWNEDIGVVG